MPELPGPHPLDVHPVPLLVRSMPPQADSDLVMPPHHAPFRSPYAVAPDTRLADAIARAERAEAEVVRLKKRLGDDVRRLAGLDERPRTATPGRNPRGRVTG